MRRWPLTQRLRLASEPTAPRRVWDFLADVCAGWNARGFDEIGGLVLSGLVSNAVLHVGGELEVTLRLTDGLLMIEVRDDGDVPAVVPPARREIGGNGLDIVSRLATDWGVTENASGGKSVWCLLTAEG